MKVDQPKHFYIKNTKWRFAKFLTVLIKANLPTDLKSAIKMLKGNYNYEDNKNSLKINKFKEMS